MQQQRTELTVRGLILGALITLVFTAANVYLGLKVGLTFASSIPAAVISMAVLRLFRNATIWENNIVQTIASAAGTLSSIIFVLPGLVMVGWWTGFPFWESFGICVVGGVLGVMYSVPLRRAMVTGSDLPYPEGVAAAEVLRVGAAAVAGGDAGDAAVKENKAGLLTVAVASVASAAFVAIVATKIFAGEIARYARAGAAVTGIDTGLSLALIGVGHLVGLTVGIAMLAGIVLAWGVFVPILTAMHPQTGDIAAFANGVWRHQVRFIGAGAIGVAAIWSLGRLTGPVVRGVISSLAAARARRDDGDGALPITERDLPFNTVLLISGLCLVPLAVLLVAFVHGTAIAGAVVPLVIGALVYVVLAGLVVAAVCGYMAGLIGSSNSPVSGLAILTVLGAALLLLLVVRPSEPPAAKALVAFALFVTAVVLNVATISNDNLQDLKTGQLVGATPWRQQVALIAGVIFGALVIPPVLDLLNHAYGFAGSPMHGVTSQPLAAPQATLISALANGVISGQLGWNLIGLGALVGLAIVAIDETLRRTVRRQFPPLAVALGIYLPMAVTLMVVVGAVAGKTYNAWVAGKPNADAARRLGVLLASGFIVGESIFGVLNAGIIVAANRDEPLALVGDGFTGPAEILGAIAFVAVVVFLYRWVGRLAQR
ncbi:oligopeptide transporter, OPT family protein [Vulcanimicrobium alpinum]|uniref:Oligopeptide transporter, OPT family protein n=1 Tax=Vulcanimicrobium alpinum TaxID=3016050 RepID=A0AAN1XWS0_UNVUL|nr:oligopeptide transporter, OPT family [Vulcanimicrobium alpinum]BDE06400.1 oligopeptide transporter, OPT family protein [Vulcanimicrobium alpinum]